MHRLTRMLGTLACGSLTITALGCCGGGSDLLIPFVEEGDDEWGYVDTRGNVVIEPDFDRQPTQFHEGFALVQDRQGDYTFINRKGEEVSDEYEAATPFSQGLAFVVEEDEHPVAINTKFEVAFEMEDATIVGAFSEGLAKFADEDGKWGFVDKKGNVVIEPEWDNVGSFKDGLAVVVEANEARGLARLGFIDKTGATVIDLDDDYDGMLSFNEGLAGFSEGDGWGFMDEKGEEVIRPDDDWDRVTSFVDGYSSFLEDGEWGLIDKKGERILKSKYENPLFFFNGLAMVEVDDEGYGFIDIHGDEVIEPDYDGVAMPFLGPCAIVKDGNDYEFIDKKGKSCSDLEMEQVDASLMPSIFYAGGTFQADAWIVHTGVERDRSGRGRR